MVLTLNAVCLHHGPSVGAQLGVEDEQTEGCGHVRALAISRPIWDASLMKLRASSCVRLIRSHEHLIPDLGFISTSPFQASSPPHVLIVLSCYSCCCTVKEILRVGETKQGNRGSLWIYFLPYFFLKNMNNVRQCHMLVFSSLLCMYDLPYGLRALKYMFLEVQLQNSTK